MAAFPIIVVQFFISASLAICDSGDGVGGVAAEDTGKWHRLPVCARTCHCQKGMSENEPYR
jgi:hypothetical protein